MSQIFRSFKANSTAICRKRAGNLAKLGFSAADHVKSDRLLDKYRANLEKALHGGNLTLVGDEQYHVIVLEDDRVVVRDDDVIAPDDRGNCGAGGKFDVLDGSAHYLGTALVPQRHGLDGFGGALAQGMYADHVSAPDVREQRADGYLLRLNRDVNRTGLDQVDVGGPIDDGDDLFDAHSLGQHR